SSRQTFPCSILRCDDRAVCSSCDRFRSGVWFVEWVDLGMEDLSRFRSSWNSIIHFLNILETRHWRDHFVDHRRLSALLPDAAPGTSLLQKGLSGTNMNHKPPLTGSLPVTLS